MESTPTSPGGVGTNKLVAGVSFPCSGFTVVGAAGGNASARGPHENPINDDADLVESKAVDKDERRTLLSLHVVPAFVAVLGSVYVN